MADVVVIQPSSPPWRPTPDTTLVAEYRRSDAPLVGVIEQHGREYLFVCADGADETASLWWYVAISQDQRSELEDASSPADFDERLLHMNFDGWSCLALATESLGILDVETVEDEKDAFDTAFRALTDRFDLLQGEVHELRLSPLFV